MSRVSTEFSPDQVTEAAYQQAIRALVDRINYERVGHPDYCDANYRLDRMRKLLGRLGDPHLASPVIHIAGTKGKGSTATLISRMLSAAGYRTGLYTSPHLLRVEERFRIDNRNCSVSDFIALVEETKNAAERVEADGNGRATYFELTTALAFLHFAQQKASTVVLEVGLGGRLDSTNVCQPIATVITSIGLDHQAQLGHTIAAIAGEKAGIIKAKVPVISSARQPDARGVIEDRARALESPLRLIARDFDCSWQALLNSAASPVTVANAPSAPAAVARCTFVPRYAPSHFGRSDWLLSLLGAHQGDNLAAALATMDTLAELGWALPHAALAAAVEQTTVPARLEVVARTPWRLVDTAHNPDSISATMAALDQHFLNQHRTIVLATSRDKDAEAMLRLILGRCERLILTQYHNNPRGMPLEELSAIAQRIHGEPTSFQGAARARTELLTAQSPAAAWRTATESAGPNDVICATGSFFQAAEVLAL